MKRIYDGLAILMKYTKGDGDFSAEHDEVWAGSDDAIPANMDPHDLQRMKALGWTYEEDMGWHHFT
jgi:hypothetical protein